MKNFNFYYANLKNTASSLKNTHFQLSGKLELQEGSESGYAQLIKMQFQRYNDDWKHFQKDLISDALQRGYNIDNVLKHFPIPELPQETIDVGFTGEWTSFDCG